MKCEEAELLMLDYLDNALADSQMKAINKHLETCEHCLDELRDYQEIISRVESQKMERPGELLRINFYHMLHGEIKKLQLKTNKPVNGIQPFLKSLSFVKIAAAVALFISGAVISGMIFNKSGNKNKTELAALQSEMQDMKAMMMLNMLKQDSPSERIQAVNYSGDIIEPDSKVLDALATTLNNDKNVNVRIAAAYSLAKFSHIQNVKDTLVVSLGRQTEPIIQVILMNILVDIKETRAIQTMQQIMTDDKSLKEVKDVAQKGLNTLL